MHAWNRIGAMLCHIGRKALHLPLFRYVDDFYSTDRPACAAHALSCFARMVRAIMGPESLPIGSRKMKSGLPIDVLGVEIGIEQGLTSGGIE